LYIVEAKENSRELAWLMENGVVVEGMKGKSQGNEDSANANDMWVWMMSQIGCCTIGKCDLLSYFISI
jgi:hypothetical protein